MTQDRPTTPLHEEIQRLLWTMRAIATAGPLPAARAAPRLEAA